MELAPPSFVRLVAHPIRWRLLQVLSESDRAVWELTQFVAEPQNLVSYHLSRFRDGGLVSARRSTADGRDRYYAIDLARCRAELQETGAALHPGLGVTPIRASRVSSRVLFLCTGNSARSQMAEALIEHMSAGAIRADSAGSNPKPLHANAVRVMNKRGIDISGNRSKHLDEFVGQPFDMVITLCDRVREVCPPFPSHPRLAHWSIPDPALEAPTIRASYPTFERTAIELETRIRFLLHLLNEPTARRSAHVQ